jgi:hypothetical protein
VVEDDVAHLRRLQEPVGEHLAVLERRSIEPEIVSFSWIHASYTAGR